MKLTHFLSSLSLLVPLACATAPIEPVPQPLPEALEWARPTSSGQATFLGVRVRENESGSLDALAFEPGALVTKVIQGSPAAEAGLDVGDVLTAWDDQQIPDPEALESLLLGAQPGQEIRLQVQRDDTVFSVPCRLRAAGGTALEPVQPLYRIDPSRSRAGWATGKGGAVMVCSDPLGPFAKAGVDLGCVVRSVSGEVVLSAPSLIRILNSYEAGDTVDVVVECVAGVETDVSVELYTPPTRVTEFDIPILLDWTADPEGNETTFALVDLWFISLFRYEREGEERHYSILRFFRYSTGVGELGE